MKKKVMSVVLAAAMAVSMVVPAVNCPLCQGHFELV